MILNIKLVYAFGGGEFGLKVTGRISEKLMLAILDEVLLSISISLLDIETKVLQHKQLHKGEQES